MNTDTLCMGCMTDKGTNEVCPQCKYQEETNRSPLVLPYRTILNDKFLLGKVLGKPGGFGITYLAWDLMLQTTAAIKEYLPREFAARDRDGTTVVPFSQEDKQTFSYGLGQFLQEAQTLVTLNHPNVIRIREFFRANNTAYLVMDYCKGISLEEYLCRKGGKLPENVALKIMLPVLSGLVEVHRKGFLHRDIKPNNIYLTQENKVMLLDFGAARVAMGEHSKSLSVVLTPGFAPYEQYHSRGKQGPWTDIYACGATLYYLLTGIKPLDAIARYQHDDLVPPERLIPGISAHVNQAILQALTIEAAARPQSIQAFQQLLASKNKGTTTSPPVAEQTIAQSRTLPSSPTLPQTSAPIRLRTQTPTPTPTTITKYCPHCGVENVLPKGTPLAEATCLSCRKPFAERRPRAPKMRPAWMWGGVSVIIGAIVVIGMLVFGGGLQKPPNVVAPEKTASPAVPTPRPDITPMAQQTSAAPAQPAAETALPASETPPPPPVEAIVACKGKNPDDPCTFSGLRQETISGTCVNAGSVPLACKPGGGPPQEIQPSEPRPQVTPTQAGPSQEPQLQRTPLQQRPLQERPSQERPSQPPQAQDRPPQGTPPQGPPSRGGPPPQGNSQPPPPRN